MHPAIYPLIFEHSVIIQLVQNARSDRRRLTLMCLFIGAMIAQFVDVHGRDARYWVNWVRY